MLINEIVSVFTNPAARSSFMQGAVNRLAQRAGTAGITQPSNAPGFAINPQDQAAQASAPLINQIAQSLNAGWSQAIQQAMAQTPNPSTGVRGVTSIKDIPRDQLERALTSQINTTLNKMSNGKIQDYEKISQIVDPNAYNGQGRQQADTAVRGLKTALGTIIATEPSQAQKTKLSRLWQDTAEKLYTISSMATFQPRTDTKIQWGQTATGQLTQNGTPVVDGNNQPIMVGSPGAAQYMQGFGGQSQASGPAASNIMVPQSTGGGPRPRTP